MAGFNFEYEAVLEHRRNMEDLAQQELAKLLRERMVLENQLRAMEESVRAERASVMRPGRVQGARLQQHGLYASQTSVRAGQIGGRLQALDRRITDARRRLKDATKRRAAIERLHDKQRRLWRVRAEHRRQADLRETMLVAGEV